MLIHFQGNIARDRFSKVWFEKFQVFRRERSFCWGDPTYTGDFDRQQPRSCILWEENEGNTAQIAGAGLGSEVRLTDQINELFEMTVADRSICRAENVDLAKHGPAKAKEQARSY